MNIQSKKLLAKTSTIAVVQIVTQHGTYICTVLPIGKSWFLDTALFGSFNGQLNVLPEGVIPDNRRVNFDEYTDTESPTLVKEVTIRELTVILHIQEKELSLAVFKVRGRRWQLFTISKPYGMLAQVSDTGQWIAYLTAHGKLHLYQRVDKLIPLKRDRNTAKVAMICDLLYKPIHEDQCWDSKLLVKDINIEFVQHQVIVTMLSTDGMTTQSGYQIPREH